MTQMQLTAEDRILIHELVNLHGHLCDMGGLDRLGEVFSSDIVYDVEDLGFGQITGLAALRNAALSLGDGNPLAHHVTNVVITGTNGDVVEVMSKGLGIGTHGSVSSVVYVDSVKRHAEGWRIVRRKLMARRRPLHS